MPNDEAVHWRKLLDEAGDYTLTQPSAERRAVIERWQVKVRRLANKLQQDSSVNNVRAAKALVNNAPPEIKRHMRR